jgi:hypothetical protein
MYKSALIENIDHQKLHNLSQIVPQSKGELALQEAAQAEMFRRVERSVVIQERRKRRPVKLQVDGVQEVQE